MTSHDTSGEKPREEFIGAGEATMDLDFDGDQGDPARGRPERFNAPGCRDGGRVAGDPLSPVLRKRDLVDLIRRLVPHGRPEGGGSRASLGGSNTSGAVITWRSPRSV